MVAPVVYESGASFSQVGACAFYEKIALYRACLVGKCLQDSAALMLAALAICFVVVPVKPFAANNDVAMLSKMDRCLWLKVGEG
ncbi:MAG: hypothetical protein WAU05_04920 [Nitrospira sp.]